MNEKKWTDDERDEAFDSGMETMQRVALELYRRGREPLLEELEEAHERNTDLRTMLEQVTRERDEARAEVERLRIALLEVQTSESAPAWFADGFHDGWKAGAAAMREACQQWIAHKGGDERTAWQVGRLPIPEDK